VTIYLADLLPLLLATVLVTALLVFIRSRKRRYRQKCYRAIIDAREKVSADKVRDEIDLMYYQAIEGVKRYGQT
jgi:hypothetical protein